MTALNFLLEPNRVCIAMDTLSLIAGSNQPFMYTSKIYPLPHLDGVMCGTGFMQLALNWFSFIQSRIIVRDIPHMDMYTKDGLLSVVQELSQEHQLDQIDQSKMGTIYHFGYCWDERRYRGFAYRSSNAFESEEIPYGLGIKPANVEIEDFASLPQSFINIMRKQKEQDDNLPVEARVGIGGEIHFFVMTPNQMSLSVCYQFNDYEKRYSDILKNLK